jgi:hypothetical protein
MYIAWLISGTRMRRHRLRVNASRVKPSRIAHLRQVLPGDDQIGRDDLFDRRINSTCPAELPLNLVTNLFNH